MIIRFVKHAVLCFENEWHENASWKCWWPLTETSHVRGGGASQPIRAQYSGHVTSVDQSEATSGLERQRAPSPACCSPELVLQVAYLHWDQIKSLVLLPIGHSNDGGMTDWNMWRVNEFLVWPHLLASSDDGHQPSGVSPLLCWGLWCSEVIHHRMSHRPHKGWNGGVGNLFNKIIQRRPMFILVLTQPA